MAHGAKTDGDETHAVPAREPTLSRPLPEPGRRMFLHATLAGAAATGLLGLNCGDDAVQEGGGGGSSGDGPTTGSTSANGPTSASSGAPDATSSTVGQGGA